MVHVNNKNYFAPDLWVNRLGQDKRRLVAYMYQQGNNSCKFSHQSFNQSPLLAFTERYSAEMLIRFPETNRDQRTSSNLDGTKVGKRRLFEAGQRLTGHRGRKKR